MVHARGHPDRRPYRGVERAGGEAALVLLQRFLCAGLRSGGHRRGRYRHVLGVKGRDSPGLGIEGGRDSDIRLHPVS